MRGGRGVKEMTVRVKEEVVVKVREGRRGLEEEVECLRANKQELEKEGQVQRSKSSADLEGVQMENARLAREVQQLSGQN